MEYNKSILIADDSMFMRSYLTRLLQSNLNNVKVIGEASDGHEAIHLFKKISPDITLLDITMPSISGIDALKEIMAYDSAAKVIMCSAMGQNHLIIDALKIGATDFVVKPNFQKLIPIIKQM